MTSPTAPSSSSAMDRSIHLAIDPSPISAPADSGGGTLSDPSNPPSLPPNSTSTGKSPKSIDEQLADTLASQAARRQYLSDTMPRNPTLISNLVHAVSTDHNTARLTLISLSLVCSFFGSLLLVLVGPDPPYQEGALYQYADLMRLMTSIHEKSIEITPSLSKRSFEEELKKNGSETDPEADPESESTRISRLLTQWWPIQKIAFESTDAILNDTNFYARNYATFQTAFIILLVFGDTILLLSWLYFLAAKELQIYRHRKHRLNGASQNGNRITSPKPLKEKAGVLVEKLKRFLSGKAIKKLKRSWFDDPPRRPWQRPAIVIITSLVTTDLLLFIILLSRPSFFALVLHQVLFTLLAVVCLASTEVHGEEEEEPLNSQKVNSSPKETVREVPRSLRHSKGSNGSNGSQKSLLGSLKKNKVTTQTRQLIAATVAEHPKAIFATEESKASTSQQLSGSAPKSPPSLRGSNPFGDDEDDDDSDSDEMYRSLAAKQKPSIDEEVERDIERV